MDALRRNALTIWPGMTIYWIGDLAHQGSVSGHNPDDYTGVRAEMLDADTDPEVRALDFMIGPRFTTQSGWDLVNALIAGVDRMRMYYVIYRSTIWRRATGFKAESYGGDNHNDHVHVSGHASDDENGSDWRSVLALGEQESDMANVYKTPAGYFVSNGIFRRGPIRTKSPFFTQTTAGMTVVTLTEEDRVTGSYPTWDAYLNAVAGPLFPALVCNCNCDGGEGGNAAHTHEVSSTTGPATPTG
jgi:hypothetical protein